MLSGLPKPQDKNLLVGFDTTDDAAVYRVTDDIAIIQTVDFFPPMVDDPFAFGQVAAANALSDIYAMGGTPKLALNLLCFPTDKLSPDAVRAILAGGADKVGEAGALLCGGHTIEDKEPKYGLAVTGFVHPGRVLANSTARAGDALILTKPLGTGILNTAAKAEMLDAEAASALIRSMTTLNAKAAKVMERYEVHACTDVTGFGLIGHSLEMAAGSGTTITLYSGELPLLPQTLELARLGIIPGGAYRNRANAQNRARIREGIPTELVDAAFDPQTSGGLLISVSKSDAGRMLDELKDECPDARIVGEVGARGEREIVVE